MKTIVFFGSPYQNSHTKHLLDEFLAELQGEVKIVDCYKVNVGPCIDCKYCFKKDGCSIKDDMQDIYDYILDCDAMVIATPMHFNIPSAPVVKVLSRLQSYWSNRHIRKIPEQTPKKKRGALLVTTGGDWQNMELVMDGFAYMGFDHVEAESVGSVYAKMTDIYPVKENEDVKFRARMLAKNLNEFCRFDEQKN